MADITIPSLGIAMEEALIVRWLKEPGEDVAEGEAVAEIETDKTTMPLESPVAGRLGPHLFEEDAVVPVGTVIVQVVADSGEAGVLPPSDAAETAGGLTIDQRVSRADLRGVAPSAEETRGPHSMTPRARRLARERTERSSEGVERATERVRRFRELIAAKVSRAWQEIPHFAVTRDVDAEAILATVKALRSVGREPTPTITDLLLRAHALALEECGLGTGDVGLAVATAYGVVIPVVRGVLALDAHGLARARKDAVLRARAGELTAEDVGAASPSTLSNLGAFGVDSFTGVIALGQTSLLTVGRIRPRVVADEACAVQVRAMFSATLNVDHRTVDGADAARLIVAFASAAESMTAEVAGI